MQSQRKSAVSNQSEFILLANIFKNQTETVQKESNDVAKHPTWSIRSSCIESMFAFLRNGPEIEQHVVLDLGNFNQAIIDSVGGSNCRFIICNLVDEISKHALNPRNDVKLIDRIMDNVTPVLNKTDQPVSTIFAWDLFNYLERSDIIILMTFISPFCRKGARLYSISWLTDTIPQLPGSYVLEPDFNIRYSGQTNQHIQPPGYSAPNLISMMPSFESHRLEVFRFGILEIILEFSHLVPPPDPSIIPTTQLMAYRT